MCVYVWHNVYTHTMYCQLDRKPPTDVNLNAKMERIQHKGNHKSTVLIRLLEIKLISRKDTTLQCSGLFSSK